MRATLTLESVKAIVNEALRRLGLGGAGRPSRAARFTVKARDLGLRPGIDPDRMNQLIDELQEP